MSKYLFSLCKYFAITLCSVEFQSFLRFPIDPFTIPVLYHLDPYLSSREWSQYFLFFFSILYSLVQKCLRSHGFFFCCCLFTIISSLSTCLHVWVQKSEYVLFSRTISGFPDTIRLPGPQCICSIDFCNLGDFVSFICGLSSDLFADSVNFFLFLFWCSVSLHVVCPCSVLRFRFSLQMSSAQPY